jgi:hypothetical protein
MSVSIFINTGILSACASVTLSTALTTQILGVHDMDMGENGMTCVERLESVCHLTVTNPRQQAL